MSSVHWLWDALRPNIRIWACGCEDDTEDRGRDLVCPAHRQHARCVEAEARAEKVEQDRDTECESARRFSELLRDVELERDALIAEVGRLREAGADLVSIVEGLDGSFRYGEWRCAHAHSRLKDAPEWVRFYTALATEPGGEGVK